MATRKLIVEVVGDTSSLVRTFRGASNSASKFVRDLEKTGHATLKGEGAFRSLGRTIAFGTGGLIAFASAGEAIRKSIDAATEAAATQRQLAAQFKASGLELGNYEKRIRDTSLATSRLSGFTETELTDAFTQAFRGSQNVSVALKIQGIAADVARGRHIDLSKATIALTKAYGGQTTALRRLGIQVPAQLTKMQALEFVSRRFAGQAEAGTTAQQRFGAALHNTEVTLGSALLPSLTKYLDQATKWLDNSENQAKLQKTLNTSLRVTGKTLHALSLPIKGYVLAWDKWGDSIKGVIHTFDRLGDSIDRFIGKRLLFDAAFLRHDGGSPAGLTGPVGSAGSGRPPGVSGPVGAAQTPARVRNGIRARLLRIQLDLAKASVTATQEDDRRLLSQQAKLIRSAISQTTNLKKRTKLYEQLGQIENQIRNIDDQAASQKNAVQLQILEDRRTQLETEKAHAQQELDLIRQRESTLKDRIKAIQSQFRDAIDTARQGIGDLFGGPVLQPSDDARRRTLGLGTPLSSTASKITADLNAQVKQFAAFQKDLNLLAKRGAPAELIRELRAQGLGAAPEAHALATAGKGTLSQFLKAFGKRERLVVTTARTTMRAQLVTLHATRLQLSRLREQERPIVVKIELDKKIIAQVTTREQQKARKGTAAQRSGRNAGVNQ